MFSFVLKNSRLRLLHAYLNVFKTSKKYLHIGFPEVTSLSSSRKTLDTRIPRKEHAEHFLYHSGGSFKGKALVLKDMNNGECVKNKVFVVNIYGPLPHQKWKDFRKAIESCAAIVMEGSCTAETFYPNLLERNQVIPIVSGWKRNATTERLFDGIQTGDMLEVNGSSGIVFVSPNQDEIKKELELDTMQSQIEEISLPRSAYELFCLEQKHILENSPSINALEPRAIFAQNWNDLSQTMKEQYVRLSNEEMYTIREKNGGQLPPMVKYKSAYKFFWMDERTRYLHRNVPTKNIPYKFRRQWRKLSPELLKHYELAFFYHQMLVQSLK